jgi:preprotein translocase subunit SecG
VAQRHWNVGPASSGTCIHNYKKLTMEIVFKIVLFLIALFMILLILVQKGRGGGLAGALGGPGGSSAFGAKAGDAFTKITAYTALVWMFVCITATLYFSSGGAAAGGGEKFEGLDQRRSVSAPADTDAGADLDTPADPGVGGPTSETDDAPPAE